MQMNLFDLTRQEYHIDKPIRLVELFAGYGSQAMALRNLGAEFEHYRVVEFDKYAMDSYNAIHGTNFKPTDICDVGGADLEITDTDQYEYIMTYSFPCFTGDTLVLTREHGYKPIKDVQIGEYVLSHDNLYHRVLRSEMTGHKTVYRIKGMGIHELRCTSNHRFYVRKRTKYYPTYENGRRGNCRRFEKPEWKPLSEIDKNYYLGVAINQNSIIPKWNGIDYEWSDGRKGRHKDKISEKLDNPDFWWLIGRYVGDGWHRSQGGIIICCAHNELSEITDIADRLGMNYTTIKERTVYKIHFADKELELFVEPFGRGAENKVIPGFVIDLPVEQLKGFIDGYMSADGSYTQNYNKASSVSLRLMYGIAQCVAKVYHAPYSLYISKRNPKCVIEGRTVNQKDSVGISWKNEKKKQDNAFYEDGYVWFPINSIEECENQEDVYDLTVEDSHSFTANGVIAHNCTDISVAGQMQGFEKGSGTRSSLLWEVERILNELNTDGTLPQVLLMENVTAIHSQENKPHFQKWLDFLESLGYTNFVEDLNATDFGIAQHRERTFVVSLLGEWNYHFPQSMELTNCMEDYFEDYISDEQALKLVVKSEKAMNLLKDLDDEDKLE